MELDKDTSILPRNLQALFEFLRTGKAPVDAPEYLMEAAEMMKKTNFTAEERKAADFYTRAQLMRISEDDYVREQNAKEIAKSLLQSGMPVEEVSKHSKLPVDIIMQIK